MVFENRTANQFDGILTACVTVFWILKNRGTSKSETRLT